MKLQKYSEVIGLPVICADNGKKIANIKDVVFCPQKRSVLAFLLESRRYELKRKAVLTKDVLSLGRDALIINDCSCVADIKKLEKNQELKDRGQLLGRRIYTKWGEDLGRVEDILFDHKNGSVEGVEISDGLLQDIIQGRKILPLFGKVEFGEDNILVDNEAVEEMMNTGGGLKRRLLQKNIKEE